MDWAKSPEPREQLVLYPNKLDEVIGRDHNVRVLDEILGRLDWSTWEAGYNLTRGQPPIHPRILASVILYGLLTRIRSSRALEESLLVRLDFRWLVEGRSIDHTTISEFRRKNAAALKDLFVQIGMIARQMGCLPLETLAFDGTRIRASNRQSGTRTPQRLRQLQKELAAKFDELEAKIATADGREEEVFGSQSAHQIAEDLTDVKRRRERVNAAVAELERIKQAGEVLPKRLPVTDPDCRLTPNKEGGFAPNYTPLATVDVDSGLIVSADVIPHTDEGKHLLPAIEDVQQQFSLESPPAEVLADGLMATGENLAACEARGITLYTPFPGQSPEDNPAVREDLTQAVAETDRERLPMNTFTQKGKKRKQLSKQAFVFDEEENCYWCPQGKQLTPTGTTTEKNRYGQRIKRHRYKAFEEDCTSCPLRNICLRDKAKRRQINHEQYETHRVAHAKRMATEEAQVKYSRRCHSSERPFAVTKHLFGARQFLLRGKEHVTTEWLWLCTAFNLQRLIGFQQSGIGPPAVAKT